MACLEAMKIRKSDTTVMTSLFKQNIHESYITNNKYMKIIRKSNMVKKKLQREKITPFVSFPGRTKTVFWIIYCMSNLAGQAVP